MKINRRWEGAHHPSSKEEGKAVGEDSAEVMNGVKEGMAEEGTVKNTMKGKVEGITEGRRNWTGAGKGKEGGTVQGKVNGMRKRMVGGHLQMHRGTPVQGSLAARGQLLEEGMLRS